MPRRVIAIGDVHGCAGALKGLLALVDPAEDDTIVMLGDCIDRGPDSRGVIEQVQALDEVCHLVPILGNHEQMMLDAADRPPSEDSWLLTGGQETLDSYDVLAAADIPHEHLLFVRTWRDFFETETHFFAHGSYDPEFPLEEQEWGYMRWRSLRDGLPAAHQSGKQAILGHTSQKNGEILEAGYLTCIDTFCCGGKWLTALDTASGAIWQVDPAGRPRR